MISCNSLDCFASARNDKLKIGIASANVIEQTHFNNWLGNGYHGQMSFLARSPERRCDTRLVMPECKSVIVCAMKYEEMPQRASLRGSPPAADNEAISSKQLNSGDCHAQRSWARNDIPFYLLHEDYHIIMMQKLEAITEEIKKEHPQAKCKCYVDTGPVLEKAWAARAGLGFIGKNTLLISPEHGSQMALGIVLADADLKQETGSMKHENHASCFMPHASSCGSCRKCLDACPTGALVAPYTLDARKCISYKFFIGKEEGGCDICQDVCPFNKRRV